MMKIALILSAFLVMVSAAPAVPSAPGTPLGTDRALAAWQARLDSEVQAGAESPKAAWAAIDALSKGPGLSPEQTRAVLLAKGLILASAGEAARAEALLAEFERPGARQALAKADVLLLRAVLADALGQSAEAVKAALSALQSYQAECPARTDCDHRHLWQLHMLLTTAAEQRGQLNEARQQALAAALLARSAADGWREALALAQAADVQGQLGDASQERQLWGQAQLLAQSPHSPPHLQMRLRAYETLMLLRRADLPGARRAAQDGLDAAIQSGSRRMQALHLNNLADLAIKSGQPRQALAMIERALPLLQNRKGQARLALVLEHNAALAHVALGQPDKARQTLAKLLAQQRSQGRAAAEAQTLLEFSEAFAAAGLMKDALELYHQERKLSAQITAANRDATLAELSTRFDREAQQRKIEGLGRETALLSAQLDNRVTQNKLWAAGVCVLLLAGVLVGLLFKRVRQLHLKLAHNHEFLRAQSQRDPLTGLANRRGLHEATQAADVLHHFKGALLLVDIDHFKHVNDGHGHAAGDLVLIEIAQRLAAAVRDNDLVARWGGEEFLIFMPDVGAAQAQALAERVLLKVGGQPVRLSGGVALRVTVSVGHVACPLPPARLSMTLERAINLADMALYTAKGQGRNRAIGVAAALADDDPSLRRIEADFERAWREGRLTLQRSPGPSPSREATAADTQPA